MFTNFYRRFIHNYSMVAPLTTLTSVKGAFAWTPEEGAVFHVLTKWFSTAPILQIRDPNWHFRVEVDASDTGVSILSQRVLGDLKLYPFANFSR